MDVRGKRGFVAVTRESGDLARLLKVKWGGDIWVQWGGRGVRKGGAVLFDAAWSVRNSVVWDGITTTEWGNEQGVSKEQMVGNEQGAVAGGGAKSRGGWARRRRWAPSSGWDRGGRGQGAAGGREVGGGIEQWVG